VPRLTTRRSAGRTWHRQGFLSNRLDTDRNSSSEATAVAQSRRRGPNRIARSTPDWGDGTTIQRLPFRNTKIKQRPVTGLPWRHLMGRE